MLQLTEDQVKGWLRRRDLPVPAGEVAESAAEAARLARGFGGSAVVKGLIPSGRRGKAGAVNVTGSPKAAADAARALIGRKVNGFEVKAVYVEEQVEVDEELYLAFTFGETRPAVVLSRHGGVDIEQVHANRPEAIVRAEIDPLKGLRPFEAVALWERAGVPGTLLARLGRLSAELFAAFRAADALMLEINPLAVDGSGRLALVGAMMGIDESAVFRHPIWRSYSERDDAASRPRSPGERKVLEADRTLSGGAVRYTELDGDIGLLVGGGGASLLQHDLMLDYGGRPANHTDSSPGPITDKLKVVLEAIVTRPGVRGLLIGYNRLQMARCDVKIEALAAVLREHAVDPRTFPIVVRLVGPAEARARELASGFEGIHYLDESATLEDAVRLIVDLTRRVPGRAPAA